MEDIITVSVIIPVLNEEKYIDQCIDAFLGQTYPQERMECLIVDGHSADRTADMVRERIARGAGSLRLLTNERRTQACAMNIGIRHARGKYIVRWDAHADYAPDYIAVCVELLETGKYDNVGGVADTRGRTPFGRTVARMMSSPFGVGNSTFRTEVTSAEVDTVPFGAFKKTLFDRIGGFDERLDRNEDNEINFRIRKKGGVVYLSDRIRFTYYCRDTLRGILNMAFQNGKWTVLASRLCPGAMRVRHFVPFAFLLSVIAGILLSPLADWIRGLFLLELLAYLALDLFFSARAASGPRQFAVLLCLFPAFHLSYGAGSLAGLLRMGGITTARQEVK